MHLIRDVLEPGGRLLARRLDELCSTLEGLSQRLHATLADILGDCIGGFVRDAAIGVIDHVAQGPPDLSRNPYSSSQTRRDYADPDDDEESRYWQDEEAESEANGHAESPCAVRQPERLATALAVGLQAASCCLRRWSGARRTLTTLVVGLCATGFAFLGGPLALALLDLAASAAQFNDLPRSIDTGAAAAELFHASEPNNPLHL
jgi:hypothetical protein